MDTNSFKSTEKPREKHVVGNEVFESYNMMVTSLPTTRLDVKEELIRINQSLDAIKEHLGIKE